MAVYVPQDPSGLGRLAEMQMRVREFKRQDVRDAQQTEMTNVNIAVQRQNLMQMESDNNLTMAGRVHMQNRPAEVNPFIWQRQFFADRGRNDRVQELENAQVDRITDLMKINPEGATQLANESLGVIYGQTFQLPTKKGTTTDISRYANLAEEQWEIDHPGVPMPPKEKMKAMREIKRAQAGEVTAVEGAKADVKLDTGAEIKEAEKTGGLAAVNNMDTYKSAYAASDNIEKIDGLIEHLESSEAITGMGAEMFKDIERAKTLFGSEIAAIKVSDTEILDAMMGSEVFPLIKALGIGARGMDTPAEREFLRAVMTGAIPLNKQTLLHMAQDRRKVAQRSITRYNKKVDDGSLDNFFKYSGIPKENIDAAQKKTESTPTVTTKAEFDALPSGTIFIEDGKEYRKP